MLHCADQNIGIGAFTYALPPARVPLAEYLSRPQTEFSMPEMLEHWSDFLVEPEYLFRFFSDQRAGLNGGFPQEILADSGITAVYLSEETASDLAVQAGRRLLDKQPDLVRNTQAVIYYSSSLHSRPAWSTPCRLQSELGLRGAGAFMVGQQGSNSNFTALQVAAEMLSAEEETQTLMLIGSERLAPPHPRVFSNLWVQGDSGSAMVVSSRRFEYRLLHLFTQEPPNAPLNAQDGASEACALNAVKALGRVFATTGIAPSDIRAVIPPNCSLPLLRRISAESSIPWENFYLDALPRFGYLGSSDLAVNLNCATREGRIAPGDLVMAFGISATASIACAVLRHEPGGGAA